MSNTTYFEWDIDSMESSTEFMARGDNDGDVISFTESRLYTAFYVSTLIVIGIVMIGTAYNFASKYPILNQFMIYLSQFQEKLQYISVIIKLHQEAQELKIELNEYRGNEKSPKYKDMLERQQKLEFLTSAVALEGIRKHKDEMFIIINDIIVNYY